MEESAIKEYVNTQIHCLRELIDEKFASRDKAIELLASKVPLIISVLGLLLAAAAYFRGH